MKRPFSNSSKNKSNTSQEPKTNTSQEPKNFLSYCFSDETAIGTRYLEKMLNNGKKFAIDDECVYIKNGERDNIIELDLTKELTQDNKKYLNNVLLGNHLYDFIYLKEFKKFKDIKDNFLLTRFDNIFTNFKHLLKEDGIIIAKFNDDDFDDFHFILNLSQEKQDVFTATKCLEIKKQYIRVILNIIFQNKFKVIEIDENHKYITPNHRDIIDNYYIFENIKNESKKRKTGGGKRKILTGPKGGKFYFNNKTNKKIYIK